MIKIKIIIFWAYQKFMRDLSDNMEATEQEIIEKLVDFLIG